MNELDLRNMTNDERAKHEVVMGCPSQQNLHPQDLRQMQNAYVPTITDEDRKTVKTKKWWEFWK